MLFVYSRVGKNRDTTRESPAGAGAARGARHKTASLVTLLSRHGAAIAYTDLLAVVYFDYLLAFRIESISLVALSIPSDSDSSMTVSISDECPIIIQEESFLPIQ